MLPYKAHHWDLCKNAVSTVILASAAYFIYEIWHMDVKTAFFNGNLLEDVCMQHLDGFVVPKHANKVCKLNLSIYGLKQASCSWNQSFDEIIKEYDFIQNKDDPCVYKKISGSALTFIVLYVDDEILIGNDLQTVKA